jgi:hypothetical protein
MLVLGTVPALRSSVKNAAARPGHGTPIAFLTQFAGSSDLPEVIDTAADVNRESFR